MKALPLSGLVVRATFRATVLWAAGRVARLTRISSDWGPRSRLVTRPNSCRPTHHTLALGPLAVFVFIVGAEQPLMAQSKPLSAVVVSVSGNVKLQRPGTTTRMDISSGTLVPAGAELFSNANAEASLGISPGLALTLKDVTHLKIVEASESVRSDGVIQRQAVIEVMEGRVVVLLPEKQNQVFDLKIKTPQGTIKPRGTFYALMVKEGQSFLAVSEGKVGLEQFIPVTEEDLEQPEAPAEPKRDYGSVTTTSPRS